MKNKMIIQTILAILTFLVAIPMGWFTTYMIYKHVEAPQVVWVLWIIQMPLTMLLYFLNSLANNMKE